MSNVIIILILIVLIGGACYYIYRAKKKGHVKCIGCPYAGTCNHSCSHDEKAKDPN